MKPFKSLEEQVDLLSQRGMIIPNREEAIKFLHKNNYYRFSGYAREFQANPREQGNSFTDKIVFDQIVELMNLDSKIRILLLEALAPIEIAIRSSLAYEAGKAYGNEAFYLKQENYLDITPELGTHIAKIKKDLRRPNQPTVTRYAPEQSDLSGVPIWVAIEVTSFGTVVKLAQYLNNSAVVHKTADCFGIARTGFSSTLHALSLVRNKAAHHDQLWNRNFNVPVALKPKYKRKAPKHKSPGLYPAIVVISQWLEAITGDRDWLRKVMGVVDSNEIYRDGILNPKMK